MGQNKVFWLKDFRGDSWEASSLGWGLMMKRFTQILVSSENKTIWMDSPIELKHPSQSLREILNAKFLSDLESKAFPKVAKFYLPFDELEVACQIEDLIATRAFDGD